MTTTRPSWAFWRKHEEHIDEDTVPISPDTVISIRNLEKTFQTSVIRPNKDLVTAIADLTLKFGIFVLLGSNGCVGLFSACVLRLS
jgi:ATP-binding cassette, subfamily A (ABC1), member 3